MADDGGPTMVGKKCPMCGKQAVHRYRPFCSRRCADIDLGRWLTGAYSVPSVEDPDGFEEAFNLRDAKAADDGKPN